MELHLFDCPVQAIQLHLERKKEINPNYSLRAFARDIEVSATYLSYVLTKKRTISWKVAKKISLKIFSCEQKRSFFLFLTEMEKIKKYIQDMETSVMLGKEEEIIYKVYFRKKFTFPDKT